MRILVVDDDEILVEVLQHSLAQQHHIVDIASEGDMGWEYVQTGEYELILLDVNLPELDGVSLCQKIRSQGDKTPILLMTAKNDTRDRILGLDAGADDYVTKPLDLAELNARIRALSRRKEVLPTNILNVNGLSLNPVSCEVHYRQQPIKLTAKEYSLLELFLRNPARVFSRSQILDKIWTFDDPPLEESVKAHIKGLRKKLKKAGIPNWIENVYGIGYRLHPQTEKQSQPTSTTASVKQEFEAKLEQMWLQYQDKMIERMAVLHRASAMAKKANLSQDLLQQAQQAAHKLAGVLGMFSRDTGTEIAREIEILLQENSQLNSSQQQQLISLVADLDSLLALDQTTATNSVTETSKLLLIAVDHKTTQELQRLSKIQGINCYRVNDVASAKIWLQTNSPYLVILDSQHSVKQEYLALIAELNARTPAIATLVIAATDSLSERVTVARAGASGFLVKPVNHSVVWQTTNQLLTRYQSAVSRILVVDDDEVFLALLRSQLEPWGFDITTLKESVRFWSVLQATQPDLVILDIEMPQIKGIELCQALRNDPNWQELPVLFLTARQDAAIIQQVFEVGGDDYIAKPVVGAELLARINNRLERSRLLHNLKTQNRLTGLNNRIQSSSKLETLLQQAKEHDQPFCLVVLTLQQLSQINLTYGHDTGDRILKTWGKILQAALRHQEITGYWGNGNFIIGLANSNKQQTQEYLTEVLTILRKQVFTAPSGDRFQVNFDCSIAEFPQDGTTLHSLYQASFV